MNRNRTPGPGGGMSDALLARLSSHVAAHMGLHFPRAKWQTLENAFSSAARELGFQDPRECATWFITTPLNQELVESIAGFLTIGETYFLREKRSFEILAQEIIPEIIRRRRGGEQRLRIWSAGCATGEEPYSIAIVLHGMHDSLRDWDISILATDINPKALRRAKEGVYTQWSFRTAPPWLKENYFIGCTVQGLHELGQKLKELVERYKV
jgi:chemotaxis protein methyltransferase CheR